MIVALDLDGTLISCEPRQSAVLQAALTRVGHQAEPQEVWRHKRDGLSTERALIRCGLAPVAAHAVAEQWRGTIEEPFWLSLDRVLPGVEAALEAMRAAGARLCLLTARSRPEWLPQQLTRLGLAPVLHEMRVVPPETARADKANQLVALKVEIFFGDSESDWRAARDAGVPFVAVSSGQRSERFLRDQGIDRVCPGLWEAWNATPNDRVAGPSRFSM
ncbi:MAG: HAD family hydrolase [Limisphaerales bacterium]